MHETINPHRLRNGGERFSVPYNWDSKFLDRVKPFQEKGLVAQLYGRASSSTLSAGRALCEVRDKTRDEAKEHLEEIKRRGIPFNYLYNGTIFLQNEFTGEFKKGVEEEVEWLSNTGVERLTVANPYLIKLIKEINPKMEIHLSVLTHPDSVEKIGFFVEMGVNAVCLDWSILRDFEMIKKIRRAFPDLLIVILVNDACLKGCPYMQYHDNLMSIASLPERKEGYPHYCTYSCMDSYANDPTMFLQATFVVPQDLGLYYDLLSPNVIFKLTDRNRSTDWIMNAFGAYASVDGYAGNVLDVITLFSSVGLTPLKTRLRPEDIKDLKQLQEVWDSVRASLGSAVYIDGSKIGGLVEHFMKKKESCRESRCGECGKCRDFAEKTGVMRIDQELLDVVRHNLQVILKRIHEAK